MNAVECCLFVSGHGPPRRIFDVPCPYRCVSAAGRVESNCGMGCCALLDDCWVAELLHFFLTDLDEFDFYAV